MMNDKRCFIIFYIGSDDVGRTIHGNIGKRTDGEYIEQSSTKDEIKEMARQKGLLLMNVELTNILEVFEEELQKFYS